MKKQKGKDTSFNRYVQCFSDIHRIYQQIIIKLKDISVGREERRRRQGKKQTMLHRHIFKLTASKSDHLVYLLLKALTEEYVPFSAEKCLRVLLFLIQTSQFPLRVFCSIELPSPALTFLSVSTISEQYQSYTLA